MAYSWVALPCFAGLVFVGAGIKTPRLGLSKVLKYLVDISYVFFFAQFFTWRLTLYIISEVLHMNSNLAKISVSFTLCLIITIIMHEVFEKPLKKLLSKLLLY